MKLATFRMYCRDQERRVKDLLARLGRKAQPCERVRRKDAGNPLERCYQRTETVRWPGHVKGEYEE